MPALKPFGTKAVPNSDLCFVLTQFAKRISQPGKFKTKKKGLGKLCFNEDCAFCFISNKHVNHIAWHVTIYMYTFFHKIRLNPISKGNVKQKIDRNGLTVKHCGSRMASLVHKNSYDYTCR